MNATYILKCFFIILFLGLNALNALPVQAQAQVFPDGAELCEFGFAATSGAPAEANIDTGRLRARADGQAFNPDHVSAEFGISFIPAVSFPADLTINFNYNGRMRDNAAPDSSYQIRMFLFNEGTGAELDSVTIDSDSLPPPVLAVINNPFDSGTITANLEANTEYRVQIRLSTEANGALAWVDFFNGNRGVDVGCLQITPNLIDSDGDAIYDDWETGGIDTDGGSDDLDLQNLGVDFRGVPIQLDPMHKDVLVEIDYFDCSLAGGDCATGDLHSHRPDNAALLAIFQAFANAPVSNPDGTTGINLWIIVDEALSHQNICDLDAICFDTLKDSWFGPSPHGSDDTAQAARLLVFHYNLWVHQKTATSTSTGESDGGCDGGSVPMWGDDFVVSLGGLANPAGTVLQQAGTFMHELGHNLGLCHGGIDDVNCKPNYLSVMSYTFQLRGLQPATTFDYSRAALPNAGELIEANLDETVGIEDGMLQTWYGPPTDRNGIDENGDGDFSDDWSIGPGSGNIDWNVNGVIEPLAAADINNLEINNCGSSTGSGGTGETLTGFDDWSNLVYNFRDSDFFPTGHAPGADEELTAEDAERIDASTWWQRSGNNSYQYRAKFVCGLQGDADVLRLTRGLYGSTINILNGNDVPAEFLKQLALSFPPAEQRPGDVYTLGLDNLPPNRALKVDCDEVRSRFFPDGFPEGYIEGFITVWSDRSLEVVGVYTLASVDADGQVIGGSSIDIEPVDERRPAQLEEADIEILKRASADESSPNSTNTVLYSVLVTNNGPSAVEDVQVQDVLDMVAGTLVAVPVAGFTTTHGSGWSITALDTGGVSLEALIPALAADEFARLDFMVIVQVDRMQGRTELRNTAGAESELADPVPDNNTDTLTTVITLP